MNLLPIILYAVFLIIAILSIAYNLLYQREIQKGVRDMGVAYPHKIAKLLKGAFFLALGTFLCLLLFLLKDILAMAR